MRGLVAVGIVAAAGVFAAGANAAFPGQNGQIVFAHENPQAPGLYLVNPDGTGRKQIVASTTPNIWQPLWSPDGTHILYDVLSETSSASLRVVDASGGAMRVVVEPPPGLNGAWTADGRLSWTERATVQQNSNAICLRVESDAQPRFCITPPTGQARGNLRQAGRWSSTGRYAWVGSRLPVASFETGDVLDLVAAGASTFAAGDSAETAVTQTRISTFDWSPDGTKLVFATSTAAGGGIGIVNADGSGEHLLGHKGFHPAWSPDGTKIVFYDGLGIAVMKADGSQLVRVTSDKDDDFPDWRPAATAYVPPASGASGSAAPAAKPAPAKAKKPAKPKKKKHT
jgi:Tol biopolymer transport system component